MHRRLGTAAISGALIWVGVFVPVRSDARLQVVGHESPIPMCFTVKQELPLTVTGAGEEGIRQADLNGDRRNDLVVTGGGTGGSFSGGFSVLFKKRISFAKPVRYLIGRDIWDVAIADLNLDGNRDVLAVNHSAGTVIELDGDGTGHLLRTRAVPVGADPRQIVVTDLNGDQYQDFVVNYETDSRVSVALNDGDGTFAPPVDYPTGPGPFTRVIASDVDGDGYPDIVVTEYGPAYEDGWVSILFGDGHGRFDAPDLISAGVNPVGVSVGHFNEDGLADIVVALNNGPQGVQVFLNQGNRTFTDYGSYPLSGNPRNPKVADLNHDGYLDIAIAEVFGAPFGSPNDVAIFAGHGDGTFDGQAQTFGSHDGGVGLVALNRRRDATPDLAVENGQVSTGPSVSILSNCS